MSLLIDGLKVIGAVLVVCAFGYCLVGMAIWAVFQGWGKR